MLKLSDFFQPLNFVAILYFLGFTVFFDVLGTVVKKLIIRDIKIVNETRLINWLIGLSLFVFLWFLTGFIVEPNRTNLLISIVGLLLITLPAYLKGKDYLSLVKFVRPLAVPIILLLPFLPLTFIKASLPPYYSDEMAYHFISPYQMLHQLSIFWTFIGNNTLLNAPRLMDTLYILTFSLTHTYSVVRLLQFLVLITALFYGFLVIKKLFGQMSAFLFILILLSMPLALPLNATIGYVDVPAYSFMLLGLLLGLLFLLTNGGEYLLLSAVFWGMSIGTKYTSAAAFIVFVIVFAGFYWFKHKAFTKLFTTGLVPKLILGFSISGGYWYIKNFLIYGNPVYPFIFHCWGKYNNSYCPQGSSFFGSWTMPVTLQTIYPIVSQLLPGNTILIAATIASALLILFFADKKSRMLFLILASLFGLELLALKYFSGFFLRYQQHLMFTLILIPVLLASIKFRNHTVKIAQYLVLTFVFVSSALAYSSNIQNMGSALMEKDYALGKITIYDWINHNFPSVKETAYWCEKPSTKDAPVVVYDPNIVSYGSDIFIGSFFVNCYWYYPKLDPAGWQTFPSTAKTEKLNFLIMSKAQCRKASELSAKGFVTVGDSDPADQLLMSRLNNSIVCSAKRVADNLYYFDSKELK